MAEQVDILYIEDSAMDAMVLQLFARKAGYERIVVVPTALDGISAARDRLPRLILTDLHLPGMNGIELVHVLKQDPATSGIPIMMLSSDNDRCYIEQARSAGVDHFLVKPLGMGQMTQFFNQYLAADDQQSGAVHD